MSSVEYEPVIGLEIHVQLKTRTKMFCACELSFGDPPNVHTCPRCLGLPGTLPVVNAQAVHYGIMIGLALGCEIAPRSQFHRKNYFYPDLPKGYQISQYDVPICGPGRLGDVRIHRVHLEEDAAKLVHLGQSGRIHGADRSVVDFNRGGTPLAEIVTEPDLRSADEAREWLNLLRTTLRAIGVSDVNMEQGSLRCDANVSVRPVGTTELGTKTELKNMNSFRSVLRAIESEIARQTALVESGTRVIQETRGWDETTGTTHSMRSKEQAHDYRYFPDPDLVPLEFTSEHIDELRKALPALPQQALARYIDEHGLATIQANQIVDTLGLADYFDTVVEKTRAPQATANFLLGDLSRLANEDGIAIAQSRVTPDALTELVALTEARSITSKVAKSVLERLWREGGSPRAIVEKEGLGTIADRD